MIPEELVTEVAERLWTAYRDAAVATGKLPGAVSLVTYVQLTPSNRAGWRAAALAAIVLGAKVPG